MIEQWDETVACADCGDPGAFWGHNRMLCEECWEEERDDLLPAAVE